MTITILDHAFWISRYTAIDVGLLFCGALIAFAAFTGMLGDGKAKK